MRRTYLPYLLFLCLAAFCSAKTITIHGYVTAVHSPGSFQIDNYRVTDQTAAYIKATGIHVHTLKSGELCVGLEVEVKGDYDRATGELKAQEIKALNNDGNVEGYGLIETKVGLAKDGHGWSGTLLANGETLHFTPETVVSVRRSSPERKEMKKAGVATDIDALSPDELGPNTFVNYRGTRQLDHSVALTRVEFQQDRVAEEYGTTWTKVQAPHLVYVNGNTEAGVLTIDEKQYPVFPSPEASTYLSRLGNTLIPAHQRELPDNNPAKVHFRFYLIDTDTLAASAFPNGVVVVSAHVFDVLQNEAQLAFMLSHEIARAVEKQDWALYQMHRGQRMAVGLAGWAAGGLPGLSVSNAIADKSYERELAHVFENQADRIGIQYMLATGYDAREAPQTWRTIADQHADKGEHVYWENRGQNLLRRSYLESELAIHYPGTDFSPRKKDSKDFHDAAGAVRAARNHTSRSNKK